MDTADFQKIKDQIGTDITTLSEADAKKQEETDAKTDTPGPAGAAPEEKGFLDDAVLSDPKIGEKVKQIAGQIPLIGGFILSMFLAPSTLKKMGITAPTDLGDLFRAGNLPKTPQQLKEIKVKAEKILKSRFQIESVAEMDILAGTSVKDFLAKKPAGFDQKRYDAFALALKKNTKDDNGADADKKVFEYVVLKADAWKGPND